MISLSHICTYVLFSRSWILQMSLVLWAASEQNTIFHTSLAIAWWILGLEHLKSQHGFWLREQFSDVSLGWAASCSNLQWGIPAASYSISRKTARLFSHHKEALLQEWLHTSQGLAREIDPSGDRKDLGWGGDKHPLGPAVLKHELLLCSESIEALSSMVSKLCPFGLVQNEILPTSAGWGIKGQTLTLHALSSGFKFHIPPHPPTPPCWGSKKDVN